MVGGSSGGEDVPADQRGICGDCDRAGLGARGPQSFSRGGPVVDISEESTAHTGASGTAKAGIRCQVLGARFQEGLDFSVTCRLRSYTKSNRQIRDLKPYENRKAFNETDQPHP